MIETQLSSLVKFLIANFLTTLNFFRSHFPPSSSLLLCPTFRIPPRPSSRLTFSLFPCLVCLLYPAFFSFPPLPSLPLACHQPLLSLLTSSSTIYCLSSYFPPFTFNILRSPLLSSPSYFTYFQCPFPVYSSFLYSFPSLTTMQRFLRVFLPL